MFKRAAILLALLTALAAGFAAPFASAKGGALEVRGKSQTAYGVDRVFEFEVADTADHALTAHGRVQLLSVYDDDHTISLPVPDTTFQPGAVTTLGVRWPDAPLIGRIRAVLILDDGEGPPLDQSVDFWVFPFEQASLFVGVTALALAIALGVMRLPRYFKGRLPSNMLAYLVEEDDTVVTLSTRFDVSWQDIVRANRLKPPYALKVGRRILIPMHGLRRAHTEKA